MRSDRFPDCPECGQENGVLRVRPGALWTCETCGWSGPPPGLLDRLRRLIG